MIPDVLGSAIKAITAPVSQTPTPALPTPAPSVPPAPMVSTPEVDVPIGDPSPLKPAPIPKAPFAGDDVFSLGDHHIDMLNNMTDVAGKRNAMDYGFDNGMKGDELVKRAAAGHFDQPDYSQLHLDNGGYNALQSQMQNVLGTAPQIPTYPAMQQPNWAQMALAGLGTFLDPRHGAENAATPFEANLKLRDMRYQHALQQYQMAEEQRKQALSTLENMAGLQTHRDTSELSAKEAVLRDQTQMKHYEMMYQGQDMRSLRLGFDNAKDPGTAMATARELQERFPQYAPSADELGSKIQAMSRDAVRALQSYEQAAWQKSGLNGLDPVDQANIAQYRQSVADTYFKGDVSKLPPLLTSETIQQNQLQGREQHWAQMLQHSNAVLDFAKDKFGKTLDWAKDKFGETQAFQEKHFEKTFALKEQQLDNQRRQVEISAQRAQTYKDQVSVSEYLAELKRYGLMANEYNHLVDLAAHSDKETGSIHRQIAGYNAMLADPKLSDDQKKQVQVKISQLAGEAQYLDSSKKPIPDLQEAMASLGGAPPAGPTVAGPVGVGPVDPAAQATPFAGPISATPGQTAAHASVGAGHSQPQGNGYAPVEPSVANLPGIGTAVHSAIDQQQQVQGAVNALRGMTPAQQMAAAHDWIQRGGDPRVAWQVLNKLGIPGHP